MVFVCVVVRRGCVSVLTGRVFFGALFWVKQVWEVFCSEVVKRLSAQIPQAQPGGRAVSGIGHMGYHADTCRECTGDLLLTFQVPQGNLETMMRILINLAGALCAYTSVGRSRTMVTVASRSQMRVVLSRPPTAMLSLV